MSQTDSPTRIPLVRATEAGKAHFVNLHISILSVSNCGTKTHCVHYNLGFLSPLEQGSREGDTPV